MLQLLACVPQIALAENISQPFQRHECGHIGLAGHGELVAGPGEDSGIRVFG